MNNNAWHAARDKAGLSKVRVHDLRHTYGARLLATGVLKFILQCMTMVITSYTPAHKISRITGFTWSKFNAHNCAYLVIFKRASTQLSANLKTTDKRLLRAEVV